jgi:hypothetical protein
LGRRRERNGEGGMVGGEGTGEWGWYKRGEGEQGEEGGGEREGENGGGSTE